MSHATQAHGKHSSCNKNLEGPKLPRTLDTRTLRSHLFYGPYVWFPILATVVWVGGILTLLLLWITDGTPQYRGDEASIVFISDVGAVHHDVFIGISCATAALYIASLFSERWLRHIDRLPSDIRVREKVFDWLAIFFCTAGSTGLILLAIFDVFHHLSIHWIMTMLFIAGVALSGAFQAAEIWSLHKGHPDRKSLFRNSLYKLVILFLALLGVVGFGVCYGLCRGGIAPTSRYSSEQCDQITSACAAFEWTIAVILGFYFATLVADLWPAGKSSARYMSRLARWQETHGEGDDFTGRRAFDEHPERWMTVEQRADAMFQEMITRNQGRKIEA